MVTGEATYTKVMEAAESALDCYLLKPYGRRLRERGSQSTSAQRDVFRMRWSARDTDRALTLSCTVSMAQPYWHFCARVAASC